MTVKPPMHVFKFTRGQLIARLGRAARSTPDTDDPCQVLVKSSDPIKWEFGRLERSGGAYYYVGAGDIWPQPRPSGKFAGRA